MLGVLMLVEQMVAEPMGRQVELSLVVHAMMTDCCWQLYWELH